MPKWIYKQGKPKRGSGGKAPAPKPKPAGGKRTGGKSTKKK